VSDSRSGDVYVCLQSNYTSDQANHQTKYRRSNLGRTTPCHILWLKGQTSRTIWMDTGSEVVLYTSLVL